MPSLLDPQAFRAAGAPSGLLGLGANSPDRATGLGQLYQTIADHLARRRAQVFPLTDKPYTGVPLNIDPQMYTPDPSNLTADPPLVFPGNPMPPPGWVGPPQQV